MDLFNSSLLLLSELDGFFRSFMESSVINSTLTEGMEVIKGFRIKELGTMTTLLLTRMLKRFIILITMFITEEYTWMSILEVALIQALVNQWTQVLVHLWVKVLVHPWTQASVHLWVKVLVHPWTEDLVHLWIKDSEVHQWMEISEVHQWMEVLTVE
jgi:hypothetical protein